MANYRITIEKGYRPGNKIICLECFYTFLGIHFWLPKKVFEGKETTVEAVKKEWMEGYEVDEQGVSEKNDFEKEWV